MCHNLLIYSIVIHFSYFQVFFLNNYTMNVLTHVIWYNVF